MNPGETLELGLEFCSAGSQSLGAQRALARNPVFQAEPFGACVLGERGGFLAEALLRSRSR